MSVTFRKESAINLIGALSNQILGSKLPSIRQVMSVFFYNMRCVKLNSRNSAQLTIRKAVIFWEKARIPTRKLQHCISKLLKLYTEWQELQKNVKKKRSYIS